MSWNGPEISQWIILKEDYDFPLGGGIASRTGRVRFGIGESKYEAESSSHTRWGFQEALSNALRMCVRYGYVGVDMYVPSVLPPGYYAIYNRRFGRIVYTNTDQYGGGGSWRWEPVTV
jgi:hypothetical protein